jgi:hypothetical protein
VSQEWPEGHICFPVYPAIDRVADPAEAATWYALAADELTNSYRDIMAAVEALAGSAALPTPGGSPSKAEQLTAMKNLIAAGRPGTSATRAGPPSAFFGLKTRSGSASTGPAAPGEREPGESPQDPELAELMAVVDRVAGPARPRVAAGQGLTAGLGDGECLALLERLARALYPRAGEGVLPGGARASGTVDDLAAGTPGARQRLAPGAQWQRVTSWGLLASAVQEAGPEATGLVLVQRRTGPGHAFAVRATTAGPRWIDLQAEGDRVTSREPGYPEGDAWAVIINADAQVIQADDLPPVPESAITALALTDPPASHHYGAIGMEIELPRIRLQLSQQPDQEIPANETPQYGDVLFSNDYLMGVVEQIAGTDGTFLELVTNPIAEVPGDNGHKDRAGFLRSLQETLNRVSGGKRLPVSDLARDGFRIGETAKHVVTAGFGHELERMGMQFTVGVPLAGLHDLYLWTKSMLSARGYQVRDVNAGLFFSDAVANRFAAALPETGHGIPLVVAELFHPEDLHAVRGYAASVFTHAMAPLWMTYARSSRAEGYEPDIGTKQFLDIASRHPIPVMRKELSEDARQFLADNADWLRGFFAKHASKFLPQSIADPLGITIADPEADLVAPYRPSATVGAYLDDAFREGDGEPRVIPLDFNITTAFNQLDHGTSARRLNPLTLNELRYFRPAESYEELRETYAVVADNIKSIFERAARQGRRASSLRPLGDPAEIIGRLAQHPAARDIEDLLRRTDFDPDPFLDVAAEIAAAPGVAPTAGSAARLAAALERGIPQLKQKGLGILDGLRSDPGSTYISRVLMPWAATMRAAHNLMALAAPHSENTIPKEEFLTNWRTESATAFRRSAGIRNIDASVDSLLADQENPERVARVLIAIGSWRESKNESGVSARAGAVDNLERRVIYELGGLRKVHRGGSGAGQQVRVARAEVPEAAPVARQILGEELWDAVAAGDQVTAVRVGRLIDRLDSVSAAPGRGAEPVSTGGVGHEEEAGTPSTREVPPSRRLHVEPVLVDRVYDITELVGGRT